PKRWMHDRRQAGGQDWNGGERVAGNRRQFLLRSQIRAAEQERIERFAEDRTARSRALGGAEDRKERLMAEHAGATDGANLRSAARREIEHGADEVHAGKNAFAGSTRRGLTSMIIGPPSVRITSNDSPPCHRSDATRR